MVKHQGTKEMPKAMVSHHNDINTWKTCKKWKNTKVAWCYKKPSEFGRADRCFLFWAHVAADLFGFQQDDADSYQRSLVCNPWTSHWNSNDTVLFFPNKFYSTTKPFQHWNKHGRCKPSACENNKHLVEGMFHRLPWLLDELGLKNCTYSSQHMAICPKNHSNS